MTIAQFALLSLYAVGLTAGQFLFKMAALRLSEAKVSASALAKIYSLAFDPYFLAAMVLYFGLSLFWVWLISQVTLARAYPFVAVNFILVAAVGAVFFSERINPINALGLVLIVAGVIFATR